MNKQLRYTFCFDRLNILVRTTSSVGLVPNKIFWSIAKYLLNRILNQQLWSHDQMNIHSLASNAFRSWSMLVDHRLRCENPGNYTAYRLKIKSVKTQKSHSLFEDNYFLFNPFFRAKICSSKNSSHLTLAFFKSLFFFTVKTCYRCNI